MNAGDQAQAIALNCNIDGGREVAVNYFVSPVPAGTFRNNSVSLGVVRIPNCSASSPGEVTFNANLPADTVGSRVVISMSQAQIVARPTKVTGFREWYETTYTDIPGFPEWDFFPTVDGLFENEYRGVFNAM